MTGQLSVGLMMGLRTTARLALAAAVAGLLALGAGCEAGEVLAPVPLPDGGTVSDSGVDAEPEAGALRQLIERPLFGTMPPPNRFFDPEFGLLDGIGWNPIDYDAWELYQVRRVFLARTPGDQPALELIKDELKSEVSVTGWAKGAAGPMLISVWLGRRDNADPTADASVALLGLQPDGSHTATALAPDGTAPITLSDIRWQRLSAVLDDGPVGDCYLRAASSSAAPLLLTSPLLLPLTAERAARPPAARRPLSQSEQSSLRAVAWAKGQRFGSRPARPRRAGRPR